MSAVPASGSMSAPSPGAQTPIAVLRQDFKSGKLALLQEFAQAKPTISAATRLMRQLARHVDGTLQKLWTFAGLAEQAPEAALVAVGGYGRGELFPHSDVDVLLLLPEGLAPDQPGPLKQAIESFITACWDIGLEIGSSVRTVRECLDEAAGDVTIQTALLESRWLAGGRVLVRQFEKAFNQAMDPRAFMRAKTLEMRQRHTKYEDTPYALEPNCKESPGGLRDLQVLIWIARGASLGKTWPQLAAKGLITALEARALQRNEGVLKLIRCRLHIAAGRREDRLVFDLQTTVAESFGYASTPSLRASEHLMRRYYWAAKAVTQLNLITLLNLEEQINGTRDNELRPVNEFFLERSGMLEVVTDDLYERHPEAILQTFLVYQQTTGIKGLSAKTLRALYHARGLMNSGFRRDPANRATFMRILQQTQGQTHAFRLMNQTSVLGRYLWPFRAIVGQMQHDLFHVYTVDQHILMVLRNMRRFFVPEHTHEYPFCSQLAVQFDRPEVLYIAALFHDIAKGRGGDHSELGAEEARRFCRAHHLSKDDAELVEFLVEHHLTLSRVAQKEDLSDPDVIEQFAALVKDERHLTALYLLTVADIRGTGPKVWNAWKGKLLEDCYRLTLRALGGAKPNLAAEIEARKTEARHALALLAQLPGTEDALWKTLELSYFARHDAQDLAWHARALWRHVESTEPVVRSRPSPVGEGLQVLVYARDQQDLFARICGYFDGAGFNILDAKVHTTRSGYALDTFQVIAPELDLHHRDLTALVESKLSLALVSPNPLPEPRKGRLSRRVKSFPFTPRVDLRPDERAQRWLLSVSASDRAGLLYGIARVLARHGINLQLAKVSTLGERVEDTFLLDGAALQQSRMQLQIENELLDVLSVR
ncbi:[protein-PII] uridylyltransferase [Roseateles terrae]|uniref:Bifunctional uridylyltransferase/uridylyl-removing enzyme n=1 Tax=Roseateles terrae TaxID=431060 RepID=A0ABR6GNN3_9BURK|nr:[protein-PII] uridylyltransferase [Roseateles terrae]MBB3192763.1 [protein-PII] uridylyltransferase [Roseateles terrae]OWQ89960.1 [protein-PII] uridylyltransferase [Roseateles terrae]